MEVQIKNEKFVPKRWRFPIGTTHRLKEDSIPLCIKGRMKIPRIIKGFSIDNPLITCKRCIAIMNS